MRVTCPGVASRLPASAGTQDEWITSAEVIDTCTGLPTGTCISFAVTIPRLGYLYSHHHWCPITSTLSALGDASPAVARMVRIVGTATRARRSSASTSTNTITAHQKMSVNRWSIARPKSDRGRRVDCGKGPAHPATARAAVVSQRRPRVMASRAPGSLFPLGRTVPELLGQWMPAPEDEDCESCSDDISPEDPGPGEPAEATLRQDRREHHERELEQEKREGRTDHQARLARRRMYHADGDDAVCQTDNEVQRGEAPYAPEEGKRVERFAHDGVHQRDPRPNGRAHNGAKDDALA